MLSTRRLLPKIRRNKKYLVQYDSAALFTYSTAVPRWRNGRPACRQAGAPVSLLPMYFVYVLRSISREYLYVGLTNNLLRRIRQHQAGYERTTRAYRPFELIYSEQFLTRLEARNREKYLKSGSGKEWLRQRAQVAKWQTRQP
jgi:putative endonuclease